MRESAHVRRRHHAKTLGVSSTLLVAAGLMIAGGGSPAVATATSIGLGGAESFSVLGGSTVTNTGPSVMSGDLGVSPGSAVTGVTTEMVGGTSHENDAVAAQAQADLTIAYNNAAGQASDVTLSSDELGGLTLVPGVYTRGVSAQLTGALTLDAQNDPDAVWVFQIGSTLTTASASSMLLVNGADPCHVFWQIGSSATLGTNSTAAGTFMALTSMTVATGASIEGRALARNGAVTLDTNRITTSACADGGGGGVDVEGTATTGTDTDGTDTAGTATTGTDTTGTDTDGTDTEGTATEGTATEGTATEGTATEGTATEGTATEGTATEGTATEGTATEGTDTEGTATEGTATEGTATEGTATEGTATEGTATEGTATEGTATEGTGTEVEVSNSGGGGNGSLSGGKTLVPTGHPHTGLGGTSQSGSPLSSGLLVLGGITGAGSLISAAKNRRPVTRAGQ